MAQPGFESKICVASTTEADCPAPFAETISVYGNDALCQPCACGAATGVNCDLDLYPGQPTCMGVPTTLSSSGACQALTMAGAVSGRAKVATKGECAPSGGEAIGGTEPKYKVCCMEVL